MKRQSTEWERICASYSFDKKLINSLHKELKKLNTQRTNNPISKLGNEQNRQFSKEEVQMLNKY
jgi:hypothetical protein